MAEQLIIRFASIDDPNVQWAVVSASGQLEGRIDQGHLSEAAAAGHGRVVNVVLSGSEAMLVQAQVPGRNRARVLAAVPYALEEGLADEVEDYHFAVSTADKENRYPVALIAHQEMQRLLELLQDYNIQAQRVLVEPDLLPVEADAWVIAFDRDKVVVRLGAAQGFSIETDDLPMLLATTKDEDKPERVVIYGDVPEEELLDQIDQQLEGIETERRSGGSVLELLVAGLARNPANLLQGEYSRSKHIGKYVKPWRWSMALVATMLVVLGVSAGLEFQRLSAQAQELNAEIENVLRQTFPDVRKVVNARSQMKQRLNKLKGTDSTEVDVIALLSESAKAISEASDAQLKSISYRKGKLDMELEAKELPILDQIQIQVSTSLSVKASIQSAKSENDRVRGRIRVEPKS